MKKPIRNVAASHRAKLLTAAAARGHNFQYLLGRWVIERFLYRLSESQHRDAFVLKGAMLFVAWGGRVYRPTRDLDLLGFGSADIHQVATRVREICSIPADDGIIFDTARIGSQRIKEDEEYEGVRVKVPASLDGAKVTMQIDVGFGDAVVPTEVRFPTVLPLAPPVIRAYPREAVIAEKFQAMIALGMSNSRMKDFFDIWTLAREQRFEMAQLAGAVRKTYEHRGTPLPKTAPIALTDEFLSNPVKRTQWGAFSNKLGLQATPALDAIGEMLLNFLAPVVEAARQQEVSTLVWEPPGPWR